MSKSKADAETSALLKALTGGEVSGSAISGRLVELEAQAATLATRLAETERERETSDVATFDPSDLVITFSLFDPI